MEITVNTLWATTILSARNPNHAQMKKAIVDHCYARQERASAPIESGVAPHVKANLYESRFDFFRDAEVPEVQALKKFCGMLLSRSVYQLYTQSHPAAPPPAQVAVDLYESWVHVTRDGGYHEVHYHPNCSWCGIYYLEVGDCSLNPPNGVNRFFSPVQIGYEDFGSMAFRQTAYTVPPEEGKLVLFPSYLEHSATPYRGKTDRIVISFNARVAAPTGAVTQR